MASLAEMYVTILPDTSKFQGQLRRGLGKVDTQREGKQVAARWGVGFNGAFGGIVSKSAGLLGAAFAGLKVGGFLKDAVSQASDLGETMSKSATVFGKSQVLIDRFAATSAKALGQSKQEAVSAAAQFGNMFNQLGIGQKPAAKMSIQMVKLASDFASFHNADITDVLEAQQAAFRGEFDSIQRFVPTINAAAVEQEGLRLHLAGSSKELTAQDKALATQSLLMKGAGKATGDFSRTSGGLANQQRILSAQFADTKAALGQKLLPVVTQAFTFLNDRGIPAVQGIAAKISEFTHSEQFTSFMTRLRAGAGVAFDFFRDQVMPRLRDFGGYVSSTILPIVKTLVEDRLTKMRAAFDTVRKAIEENKPQLTQIFNGLRDVAKVIIEKVIPFLGMLSNKQIPILGGAIAGGIRIIGGLVDAFNAIKGPVAAAIRFVIDKFLNFVQVTLDGAAKAFGWVPGLGGKLKNAAKDFSKFRDDVNNALEGVNDQTITVTAKLNSANINRKNATDRRLAGSVGRAYGGPIRGRGTGTSDSIPAMLSNGEHVWTAREVRNAGGHAAMEAMRRQFQYAAGGAVAFNVRARTANPNRFAKEVAAHAVAAVRPAAEEMFALSGTPGKVRSFRGVRLNDLTIARLAKAEQILGRVFHIIQGSYSTSVAASGGTHAGGGALDTDGPGGWSTAVRALRAAGFAAWHRTPAQGPWGHHIHSIAIGDPSASPAAKAQVRSFLRGGNGLGGMFRGGPVLVRDHGGALPHGAFAYNGSGRTETVVPGEGTVELGPRTIAALADAIARRPSMLDGRLLDAAVSRRALTY